MYSCRLMLLKKMIARGMCMKILDQNHCLGDELKTYKNADIVIVSAFVSGISNHLEKLIKQNKHVSLYTGVLNGFNNPSELKQIYKLAKKNKKFDFYVNFNRKTSTHWKLYLISPSTIIIGSANYTEVGLETLRDTMLHLKNLEIYEQYKKKILADKKYYNSKSVSFVAKLKEYKKGYKESYAQDIVNEVNVEIPLFVWGHDIPEKKKKMILQKANELNKNFGENIERSQVRDFFSMPGNKVLYSEGERVFCVNHEGKYPSFHYFDRVFFDDGYTYMISLKRPEQNYGRNPLKISDMVDALKKMSKNGKTIPFMNSVSLNDLLKKLK